MNKQTFIVIGAAASSVSSNRCIDGARAAIDVYKYLSSVILTSEFSVATEVTGPSL